MGGIAMIGPSIYYSAYGPLMLLAYSAILAFPLTVVVPFAAFRSLAAENEDNTYELLSITTLRPRQIIAGKLGSSVVQMAVYFSAITPCLAFTYLLRGIDIPTICLLLVAIFFGSLGLSMIGILVATLSTHRYMQVIFAAAYVGFLLMAFFSAFTLVGGIIESGALSVVSDEMWLLYGFVATIYFTTFALAFCAATARISFSSANRSTPLRLAMLVQQAAMISWFDFGLWGGFQMHAVYWSGIFAFLYWLGLGSLLISEKPNLSARVKRSLPQSTLGRVFLSWLNPGPVTGYFFVVANITGLLVVGVLVASLNSLSELTYFFYLVTWGYVVAYLGLGRLIVAALRRFTTVTLMSGFLISLLLILIGSGIPYIIQMMSVRWRYEDYTTLQIPNPFWSLTYLVDQAGWTPEAVMLVSVVPTTALCVLLLNVAAATREIRLVRTAPPKRVLEEDAELYSPPALPKSPWDDPAEPEINPT
jgi:hypothetical protein